MKKRGRIIRAHEKRKIKMRVHEKWSRENAYLIHMKKGAEVCICTKREDICIHMKNGVEHAST